MEFPGEGGSLDFFLGEVSAITGILNGSTVAPDVTEILVGTAVVGRIFPVMR